jgi:hypothetical protein
MLHLLAKKWLDVTVDFVGVPPTSYGIRCIVFEIT